MTISTVAGGTTASIDGAGPGDARGRSRAPTPSPLNAVSIARTVTNGRFLIPSP
jgi:hypothetical protein